MIAVKSPAARRPDSMSAGFDARVAGPPAPRPAQSRSANVGSGPSAPIFAASFIFGGAMAMFVVFGEQKHLFGRIGAVTMGALALHGLWRGGFRKVAMLGGAIGLTWAAGILSSILEPLLAGIGAAANGLLVTTIVMAVASLAYYLLHRSTKRIRKNVIERNRRLLALDRYFGAVVGAAEGLLILLCLAWPLSTLQPASAGPTGPKSSTRDQLRKVVTQLSNESRTGRLGELVASTNPFERVPALKKMIADFKSTGSLQLPQLDLNNPQAWSKLLESLPKAESGELEKALKAYSPSSQSGKRK